MTTPPEFDSAWGRANRWPAFSNGTEGEAWTNAWCGTCLHGNDGEGCVLVDVALLGRSPAQWSLIQQAGLISRYDCDIYDPAQPGRNVREYLATGSAPNASEADRD